MKTEKWNITFAWDAVLSTGQTNARAVAMVA